MQAVSQENTTTNAGIRTFQISAEFVAYAALIVLALVLRVGELDTVPLTNAESRQALAAWRALNPDTPGMQITPESPLLFLLHSILFNLFGASEFTVRISTALAGAFLVLSPLLFRDVLGRGRTFLFSLLLTFSPVLLISSRFDSATVWSMGFAVLGLWAMWRFWERQQAAYALLATIFFTSNVFLTDPAGFVLAFILAASAGFSLMWSRADDPDNVPLVRERMRAWPGQVSLISAALLVVLVSTVFVLYLPGLSSVSESLLVGLRGIITPVVGAPPSFPVLTLFFYEPVLLIFGIASVIVLMRRGMLSWLDRFLIIWLLLAIFVGLAYRGGRPEYGLWLVVPLAGLVSSVTMTLLAEDKHPFLDIPWWAKPVLAAAVVGLLAIFGINFSSIARNFLSSPLGALEQLYVNPINGVWAVISLLFIIVGYFLAASLWGVIAALRGGALGLLIFGMVTALGSGWNAAVPNADSPIEFWHSSAVGREVFLLRDRLDELARRESGGVPRIPISVLAPEDGIIAWTVRDYSNVRFIIDASEARTQEIALLPMLAEPPDLSGAYVGEDYVISRDWNLQSLQGFDFLAWWMQRRTRVPALPAQTMVLWLRQDIYDGAPFVPGSS